MKTPNKSKVIKQSAFCMELMERVNNAVDKAEVQYGRIKNHTRIENDIVRLRRELNELHDMLSRYGYEDLV